MDELIKKQDAIDAIMAIPDSNWTSKHYANAIKAVKPTQQWIPCSERLPKTSKWRTDFIVTTSGGSVLTLEWENTVVRGEEVSRWVWHDRVNLPWEIIAWMELPEAWEGRSEENG